MKEFHSKKELFDLTMLDTLAKNIRQTISRTNHPRSYKSKELLKSVEKSIKIIEDTVATELSKYKSYIGTEIVLHPYSKAKHYKIYSIRKFTELGVLVELIDENEITSLHTYLLNELIPVELLQKNLTMKK